ncbi:hypothetical protein I8751_16505 [Nostocaceae cyanobacterium CENA357]|uniref:Uncharacterized protein n=2 Tax=Atlanticothrix TaxID=2840441 RepID=A0A8J7L3C9_9CYAN|nr:hypothetical protein [Atlanticothrix silvestris CENA357]
MDYSYQKEFQEALERTKRLGFTIPKWKFNDRLLRSKDSIEKISNTLMNFLRYHDMSFEDLSAQCIAVHTKISEIITQVISCNALVTIGWFYDENINDSLYKFTEEEFKSWMSNELQAFQGSDVHVWITLDSGEVIDFTLLTTIGKINGMFKPGSVLMARPEKSECFIKYHPMVVGKEAVFRAFGSWFLV